MQSNCARWLWIAVALSLPLSVGACSKGQALDPLPERVAFPATPPDFGKPVDVPVPADDPAGPKIYASEAHAAIQEANRRLSNDAEFWNGVQGSFGRKEAQ